MAGWNDESHDLLDALIRELEQAWRAGGTIDLARLLPATGHPVREQALLALIQTDQELRWQYGQCKSVDEYLAEWPELRERTECVAELQESERRLRIEARPAASARSVDPAGIADAAAPVPATAIRIRCPHCHQPVEILDHSPMRELTCPSCGSGFKLAEDTASYLPSSASTATRPAPRRIAHFELLEMLGQGAFGSVWKARDTKLNRIAAIKIPRRSQLLPDDMEGRTTQDRITPRVRALASREAAITGTGNETVTGRQLSKLQQAAATLARIIHGPTLARRASLGVAHLSSSYAVGVIHHSPGSRYSAHPGSPGTKAIVP